MKSYLLFLLLVFCVPCLRAEIDPNGEDAPPELRERARNLVARHDYAGVEALVAEVDAQYAGNRGPDYFRALVGIESTIKGWDSYPAKPDYARIWLSRKLHWKLLLTPYSRRADAPIIQYLRDSMTGFGAPIPLGDFDRDQFIALRHDALNMLFAYRDSLVSRIIPNYQHKPGHGPMSIALDPKAMEKFVAKLKAQEPELTRNDQENAEQDALERSLHYVQIGAIEMLKHAYCWPPDDDTAVNAILDAFPPKRDSRAQVISFIAAQRGINLADLKHEEQKRKSKASATPAKQKNGNGSE
jgi:hypothetical protein